MVSNDTQRHREARPAWWLPLYDSDPVGATVRVLERHRLTWPSAGPLGSTDQLGDVAQHAVAGLSLPDGALRFACSLCRVLVASLSGRPSSQLSNIVGRQLGELDPADKRQEVVLTQDAVGPDRVRITASQALG
jgi:hypothetical protein